MSAPLPLPPLWHKTIDCGWVEFESGDQTIRGYFAAPKSGGPHPGVVKVHENLGVTEHRQEMTRRLAEAGYGVLTVDLFSREGGRPPQDFADAEERRAKAFVAARDEQAIPDLDAGLAYLAGLETVDQDRLGAMGYCMGGGTLLSWICGGAERIKAAVAFYPNIIVPGKYRPDGEPLSRLPIIKNLACPLQIHFGESDHAVPPEDQSRLKKAIEEHGLEVDWRVHAGAGHAFQDNTIPTYHPKAAAESWAEGVAFLDNYLK